MGPDMGWVMFGNSILDWSRIKKLCGDGNE